MTRVVSALRRSLTSPMGVVVLVVALVGLAFTAAPSLAVVGVHTVSISDATVNEGTGSPNTATFTVTVSGSVASATAITVDYATADGTAVAPGDYTAKSGTVTFAPGVTSMPVTIAITSDTFPEPNETFKVDLSAPTQATIADGEGIGTITNDDGTAPSRAINDVTTTEGNSGTSNATFTVTRTDVVAGVHQAVSVVYTTVDNTATSASGDYTSKTGTLTFSPTDTTQTFDIAIAGDTKNEGEETFLVNLSSPVNATISDSQGQGTIHNDDAVPVLSIGDLTLAEGTGAGTTAFNFDVTLSAASGRPVSVNYSTANVTAVAGSDYTATSGTLVFNEGEATKTITVPVTADSLDEPNETFTVDLSGPSNATISPTAGQGTGTIADDDAAPVLSIGNATVTEGNTGLTTETFTVSLTPVSGQAVTVDYATANNSALAPGDYVATSGTITFPAGTTSASVSVQVKGDTVDEPDETYYVNLSNPTKATISATQGQGTGVIADDDGAPSLSIADSSAGEGDGFSTFTVTLAPASGQPVTVNYATTAGTATAGSDYTTASGTLTFDPGDTTKTFTVPILDDSKDEPSETYTAHLSGASGATIGTATSTGTIVDNDPAPSLSIDNVPTQEGNSGTTNAVFTITLSQQSAQTVTVHYATADGTATQPSDYTAVSGTLTFAPDDLSKTISVPIVGDTNPELNETYTVNLTAPTNATINNGQGTGTISNDDGPPAVISINDVAVAEAGTKATFTVTIAPQVTSNVTVHYATADGTATQPADYTAASGNLTFAPGETTKSVDVPVINDTLDEANESFVVNLTNPSANASISDAQGTATINDDDAAPALSINDATVTEGNTGTVNATFTVTLSPASGQTVMVHYATADGTATQPADYTTTSGDLSFAPGDLTKTIVVPVKGDTVDEADEGFVVNLTAPTNATTSDAQGAGTITDDDASPSLSINDATVTEGNSGTTNATFTVTLSAASGQIVMVHYATADGTATQPSDYTTTSGDLSFAPGDLTKTIDVPVKGDTDSEPDEGFSVNLTAPVHATTADALGAGTITNDDVTLPGLAINDVTVTEGDSGTTNATFTVTKTGSTTQTVTVHYATSDATATQPADYASTSGDLSFAPADTTKTFTVAVVGDTTEEPTETFTATLSAPTNATLSDATGTGTITNDDGPIAAQITSGADAGGSPHVRSFTGSLANTPSPAAGFLSYEPDFGGGVRVARGDFDGDGRDEIVTGSGPGRAPTVRVWSPKGQLIATWNAYGADFTGGIFVAVADVTGDSKPEIITGAGAGGGPHVRVFDSAGNALAGWFAYPQGFAGGVTVAAGEVTGGGKAEVVTGAGAGGGPHVRIFSGDGNALGGFFAYDPAFTGGVYVAAGGGHVVTGAGAGGGPHVRIFDVNGTSTGGFFAYDPAFKGGVRVAVGDIDAASGSEIVTGPGPGGGPHVRAFQADGTAIGTGFFAYDPSFTNGIYVTAGHA